jgi:signal peptidase I
VAAAPTGLKGTWPQALSSLALSVVFILAIRWALFEPYVIPSGSMIPSLLIHDHILVNKFSYGIRLPFSNHWLIQFGVPKRGDVVVFKSVEEKDIFLVKRVVGLPGDEVKLLENGTLLINGVPAPARLLTSVEANQFLIHWPAADRERYIKQYEFRDETLDQHSHIAIRVLERTSIADATYKVPAGSLFMMGDNRDNSADSRVWGVLPIDHVLGRASLIWLSCEETLPDANQICDPHTIRWNRLFEGVR